MPSPQKGGWGVFAKDAIGKDELLVDYSQGKGAFISQKEANSLYDKGIDHMIQVDEDKFFAATKPEDIEDGDFINHSCDPNSGLSESMRIIARRPIKPGEEITLDYAMFDSSPYTFSCLCNSPDCRKIITGEDWQLPELQHRYKGFFSPYLEKRINKLSYI